MKKRCGKCGKRKPLEEFGLKDKKSGTRTSYCRKCNKEYQKEHYSLNKKIYKEKAKRYKEDVRQRLFEFMQDKSCIDCGESRMATLQFDHVRGKKDRHTSDMVRSRCSWSLVLKEIEKCEIRCANCHAVKTAVECGWYEGRT